jgi:hypothetical protein
MVKDSVNAIALPTVEDIRRDSDLFIEGVRSPEYQDRMQAAMKSGFQTRDAEMNMARMPGDLADAKSSNDTPEGESDAGAGEGFDPMD